MGWTYTQGQTKDGLVQECLTGYSHPVGFWPLAYSVVGNHLWVAFASEKKNDKERFLGLYLMNSHRGYGWGYKAVDEAMGPYESDCPLYLLDLVPEPPRPDYMSADYNFRANVRAYHAAKQATRTKKAALKIGDVLNLPEGFNPRTVTVTSVVKNKIRGASPEGLTYRIPPRIIAKATIVPVDGAAIEQAAQLGKDAFHSGKKAVPVLDPALNELLKQNSKIIMPLLDAWTKAWHAQNTKLSADF